MKLFLLLPCLLLLASCQKAPDTAQLKEELADVLWTDSFTYEYTYLDLDGDGEDELLIQMEDDPQGYNGVFHYEDGQLVCWNSDAVELSCWDSPLQNGYMVRQYHYNGTRSYTVFRYLPGGETEESSTLFARDELIPEDSTEPCPYYEVNGEEVTKEVFDRQVELITTKLLDRSAWTIL